MVTTSSAFPPEFQNRERHSRVHEIYLNWKSQNIDKNPIIDFRKVNPDDIVQLEELHKELFPIIYDSQFYEGIVSGITQGWVAIWKLNEDITETNFLHNQEFIVGFITTSQDSKIIKENDYKHVIQNIPENFVLEELKLKIKNDEFIIGNSSPGTNIYKYLVYILTMGVVEEFRFLGIAKQLLNIVIGYYYKFNPEVNAIYLHVIDYNNSAINLYKRLKFNEIIHWNNFYKIFDDFYGAFLFSYYFDRSNSNTNLFDEIISNGSYNQNKKKYNFVSYFNKLISSSSKYLKGFN